MMFSNFLNFFAFSFWEFSFPGQVGTEFGTNFFFFLGLSQPGLDRNNVGMKFINFLNFFRDFHARVEKERNLGQIFIFHFLFVGLSQLDLDRNIARMIFFNFFSYFLEFSSLGCVGTEFGTIFFFLFLGLSQPRLDRSNAGKTFFNFWNFFSLGRIGTEFRTNFFLL